MQLFFLSSKLFAFCGLTKKSTEVQGIISKMRIETKLRKIKPKISSVDINPEVLTYQNKIMGGNHLTIEDSIVSSVAKNGVHSWPH